jgi:hypothetical protein
MHNNQINWGVPQPVRWIAKLAFYYFFETFDDPDQFLGSCISQLFADSFH